MRVCSIDVFFRLIPEMQRPCQRSLFHFVRSVFFQARPGPFVHKKEFPAFPPLAMSCLRANMTSLMRDKSLPDAETDFVKSHVEHTRIHLFGLAFMFSSSAKLAAWF